MNAVVKAVAVAGIVGLGFSSMKVHAEATTSLQAYPLDMLMMAEQSWTWTDFGGQVVGWAAGGAAGGAVTAAMIGSPVGALCGGLVGGVSGAVSGGAYYAGTQAWNYMIGSSAEMSSAIAPVSALD